MHENDYAKVVLWEERISIMVFLHDEACSNNCNCTNRHGFCLRQSMYKSCFHDIAWMKKIQASWLDTKCNLL